MNHSKLLQCPLDQGFFRRSGKAHRSEIRRSIYKLWDIAPAIFYQELRKRLQLYGYLRFNVALTTDWKGAFPYAEEWNRYPGIKNDRMKFQREVTSGNWLVQKGELNIDVPTWLTLASLSFRTDTEKESPNHLFLKELLKLYLFQIEKNIQFEEEVYLALYGEQVRCDLVAMKEQEDMKDVKDYEDITCVGDVEAIQAMKDKIYVKGIKGIKENSEQIAIVGEVGGVQVWKVMALLYQGYKVIIFPHWTRQKVNPFIRKRLIYTFYTFEKKEGIN